MQVTTSAYRALTEALDELPGIGHEAAARLSEWLVYQDKAGRLSQLLQDVAAGQCCPGCNLLMAAEAGCGVCRDSAGAPLLVVATVADAQMLRSSGVRLPLYCLHGLLSPAQGIGPVQLKMDRLLNRLATCQELIVATAGSVEGQVTAEYIIRRSGLDGRMLTLADVVSHFGKPTNDNS